MKAYDVTYVLETYDVTYAFMACDVTYVLGHMMLYLS